MKITIKHKNKGLSLIELLISIVLALLLTAGAITLFINNKRVYTEQNEISVLQDNARFAMEILSNNIRMIGYVGCHDELSKVVNNVNNSNNEKKLVNFKHVIEGFEEGGSKWLPSSSDDDVNNIVDNTDAITVRYIQPLGIETTTDAKKNSDLKLQTELKDELIAISDCSSTDVFKNSSSGNTTSDLSKIYSAGADINQYISRRYFIRNSENDTGPALWWSTVSGAEELIEGVENMQIVYGIDNNNNGNTDSYVKADSVMDWSKVLAVKIALLFRTVDEYGIKKDTKIYNLLGNDFDPVDDRRRRRIFTSTIQIRNR